MIAFNPVDCLNELEGVTPNRDKRILRTLGSFIYALHWVNVDPRFGVTPSFARVSTGLKAIIRRIIRAVWIHRELLHSPARASSAISRLFSVAHLGLPSASHPMDR